MKGSNLTDDASIKLSVGHLIVLWNLISNKLSCEPINDNFTEEEKRAVWAFEDLCEYELVKHGHGSKPKHDWDELITKAQEFCKTLPAEFLD